MKVTAPYNFVPLSNKICRTKDLNPALGKLPSQDVPDSGSLSGEISLTLTSKTPFLISGPQDDAKSFLSDPNGSPIIPGSSLRGMIRNVMEIASFARFGFVDDRMMGVRDLAPTSRIDYGDRITEKRLGGFAPKTLAGWLSRKDGQLVLRRCAYARIDHSDLDGLARGFRRDVQGLSREKDQEKRQAKQVHDLFVAKGGQTASKLWVEDAESAHQHNRKELTYRKVLTTARAGYSEKTGTLVFTGLPGSNKHMEFFFFDSGSAVEISEDSWRKFISVHEEQEKENQTWVWRREQLDRGEAIPVFWLPNDRGDVDQFGLAMMFKLAADYSTHAMIENTSKDHRDESIIDLPTRIFGRIAEEDSFKTRVSFGYGFLKTRMPDIFSREVVAAAPKPGFLPSSVRQRDFAADDSALIVTRPGDRPVYAQYRSYMDWEGDRSELRGWKRYPVRGDGAHEPPKIPDSVGSGARSRLNARYDPEGMRFEAKVRFHNVQPIELGALLWCLDFGGDQQLRHSLGMGKAYGWGQISVAVGATEFRGEETRTVEAVRAEFVDAMEAWAKKNAVPGEWSGSKQVLGLLAMADPALGAGRIVSHLKQMVLNPDINKNDFLTAKRSGSVLPEYLHASDPWKAPQPLTRAKGTQAPRSRGGGSGQQRRGNVPPHVNDGPFRKGERVTWVDEGETVTVDVDEIDGDVGIKLDDGDLETVSASELKR